MSDDNDNANPLDGIDTDALDAWYEERRKRESAAEARKKKLGPDFDTLADALYDHFVSRTEKARADAEGNNDEPPAREGGGGKPKGLLGFLGGE
jgi:hypothetical protein